MKNKDPFVWQELMKHIKISSDKKFSSKHKIFQAFSELRNHVSIEIK